MAVAVLLVIASPCWVLSSIGRWLVVGNAPHSTDYAMVLPGGAHTRPFVAAAMVRRGMARGVLIPRSDDSPMVEDGVVPPTHEILRRALVARGVKADQISFLDAQSTSTWQDAEALSIFLREHPHIRVAVITSDCHTRRTRWVFRRVLGDIPRTTLTFVSTPGDHFGPDDWWKTRGGISTYASEYCKYAFYLVRYGDPWVYSGLMAFMVFIGVWTLRRRVVRPERSLRTNTLK